MSARDNLLAKANRFLKSAQLLADDGDFDSAVSRIYYAAFHTASALLDSLGQSYSSHRGVISAYGREFSKSGRLDPRFGRLLLTCFEKRQIGDYEDVVGLFSRDEVDHLLTEAKEFVTAARQWLHTQDQPS